MSASSIGSREILDAEQEPLRCTRQTGCYMMDDILRGVSSADAILPMVSAWCGASLPMPQGPQSLATRQHPQCQTERWVVAASLKSARAVRIKHQGSKNKRCKH